MGLSMGSSFYASFLYRPHSRLRFDYQVLPLGLELTLFEGEIMTRILEYSERT